MAKLSCSLFFVLMLVFSACLMVERAEGKRCFITIDQRTPCDNGVDCRLSCYTGYNGVGKCFDDHKVPGPSNCGCTYNLVTGEAPAFDGSVRLYNAVKKLGFTIILLTGRDEYQRGITESNLKNVGYSGWDRLILRGSEDQGKAATEYISEQRAKLVEEGFKIRGNVGDQWSDLLGSFVADRSFKVPNPMYYIP